MRGYLPKKSSAEDKGTQLEGLGATHEEPFEVRGSKGCGLRMNVASPSIVLQEQRAVHFPVGPILVCKVRSVWLVGGGIEGRI